MKVLTVDFELIVQCMRDLCREFNEYYLDKNSGKVIVLSRKLVRALMEGIDRDPHALPDWEAKMIPLAREIVLSASPNFVRIPEAFGCPEHRWMAGFSKNVSVDKLKQKLTQALRGRGSCRRFKEILKEYPEESRNWILFSSQRWEESIQRWLESLSILAISENPKKVRTAA